MMRATKHFNRRQWMRVLGTGLAALPLLKLAGCGDESLNGDAGVDAASGAADAATDAAAGSSAFATGGTAAMTAKASYPDPFASGVGSCTLPCETTQGPCTSTTIERQDVSEGYPGLPVRLALRIVTAGTCAPVSGAKVEIWHTQRTGVYSGTTPSGQMCYGNDPSAVNHLYFRGTQTTDATGRVDFDTCFPGWYSGRAIHIHFRVYLGADLYLTSQLFFDPSLTSSIFSSHPEYTQFGQPNTSLTSDNVIGQTADKTPYLLDTALMSDGAIQASKVIAIKASASAGSCSA